MAAHPRHRHRTTHRRHRVGQVDAGGCGDHTADARTQIAYNRAAGAEAKERTLRSYVEGHYKSERQEATGRSRAKGLRQERNTYSVILGVFSNRGYDETVTLAQVFQQRDTAGQPYRFYVTATKQLAITTDFADFGSDLRDLRKRLRSGGAEVVDEFPKYSTSLRRLLGIRSEQALELLHQTVSMKSVGNLNDFVRNHMLEPSDAGERVRDIIDHFDNLTKSYDAVKRARELLEALDPIVVATEEYDAALAEREALDVQRAAIRLFIAENRSRLLADDIATYTSQGEQLLRNQDAARGRLRELARERESLIEERARAGGDRVGELERLAAVARDDVEKRRHGRSLFDATVTAAGFAPVTTVEQFTDLHGFITRETTTRRGEEIARCCERRRHRPRERSGPTSGDHPDRARRSAETHQQPATRPGPDTRTAGHRHRPDTCRPALRG